MHVAVRVNEQFEGGMEGGGEREREGGREGGRGNQALGVGCLLLGGI